MAGYRHGRASGPVKNAPSPGSRRGEDRPAASIHDPDGPPPCHLCTARCCRYFALEIGAPKTPRDFDRIRWFLMHESTVVWVQEGDWYLEVDNRCRHLRPDDSCSAYETRPHVCRDYGTSDEGPCEFFTENLSFTLYFDSAEKFEAWAEVELEKRERRLRRRRERYRNRRAAQRAVQREASA